MAFSTRVKDALNRILSRANLRVETLTAARQEEVRLERLKSKGHFQRAVFPIPESFKTADVSGIVSALSQFRARFDSFEDAAQNDVRYSFANDYFHSPDAEVLYTLVRTQKPQRLIEIGSGNSTKIARQAIIDGKLKTHLLSIDPQPRTEVDAFASECIRRPVEEVDPDLFNSLQPNDILFIDSSHEVRIGNDGAFLYTTVLPSIATGVLVQIHDVFLPYDYPRDLLAVGAISWNEQYIVQSVLAFGNAFEVIWPGHFLQQTRPDFANFFPRNTGERAQSLWLRKT